jgi:nucleotide-binding universal stress UspA family protein
MSIKTILVYLPSEKNAAVILDQALKVASARNAHIIGLHLIPDLPIYGEFPAEVSEEVIERLEKVGRDAATAAKRVYEDMMKASSVTHEWRSFTASYALGADLIAQHGHSADLIICGKTSEDVPDAWSGFAETAIMRSGRPVLIVPNTRPVPKQIGNHAVIAWNDTREAARAVFDAVDLMRAAATVRAITFIEKETQRPAAEAHGENLIASLSRHGIHATLEVSFASSTVTGEAILSTLLDEGCDLLVMGAYSHSRFREMIFGGVSRDILRETWVPTLVSH